MSRLGYCGLSKTLRIASTLVRRSSVGIDVGKRGGMRPGIGIWASRDLLSIQGYLADLNGFFCEDDYVSFCKQLEDEGTADLQKDGGM